MKINRIADGSVARAILMLLLLTGLTGITGCAQGTPSISIEMPVAHLSSIIAGAGSVFLKINNTGNGSDTLLSAKTDMPDTITELHDVIDGKMNKINAIVIPAGNVIEMRPLNRHIMIFNMPKKVREGYEFTVFLTFEKSGIKPIYIKFQNSASPKVRESMH